MNVAVTISLRKRKWAKLRAPRCGGFAQETPVEPSNRWVDKSFLDAITFYGWRPYDDDGSLRILKHTDIVQAPASGSVHRPLHQRPAFKRALDAQIGRFQESI